MKKLLATTILSVVASGMLASGFLHVNAKADEAQTDALFLPVSYEQYLPLSDAPTDVAVSDNYTAIADGTKIYLYDRAKNV